MGFLDDNDKEKENINGAECERKQGNDEGSSSQLDLQSWHNDMRAMTGDLALTVVYTNIIINSILLYMAGKGICSSI